jgi:hypothetical protein
VKYLHEFLQISNCMLRLGYSYILSLFFGNVQLFKKTVSELMSEGKALLPLPDVSSLATAYFERLPKGTPLKREGISPRLYLTAEPGLTPHTHTSASPSNTPDSIRYISVDAHSYE